MHVIYQDAGPGWWPIEAMARLTARLLDGTMEVRDGQRGYRLSSRVPVPRRRRGSRQLLIVAPTPRHLSDAAVLQYRRDGYAHIAAWCIDSFWTDLIPRPARRGLVDQLFITDAELVEPWEAMTGTPTVWLPWGSDALGAWDEPDERDVDLLRLGREPEAWSDDERNRRVVEAAGLRFQAGAPFASSPMESHENVQAALRRAKCVIAFGNSHDATTYTHPHREYVTARWTDALAHGTMVAGIPPRCRAADRLLWPEGLVEIPADDLEAGVRIVGERLAVWRPESARDVRREALRRLDWRHRIAVLRDHFGLRTPALDEDLARIGELTT